MSQPFVPAVDRLEGNLIKVIGVGGGGSNAVNYMYQHGIEGVDFFVCNTDAQALRYSPVPNRIQLGLELTQGLGAGSQPEMGEKSAVESMEELRRLLEGNTKMAFITAGMGGGTGTGAAPVIAKLAQEMGILTVGIVTIPFEDEGPQRINQANEGVESLRPHVDALLTICNDRIVDMYGDLTIGQAFSKADDILCTAAKGIAEIITRPGQINVDFMDVLTAMRKSGRAILGTGVASGENRAENAVKIALDSPLLDNVRIKGAQHLLVNFTYGDQEPLMSETRAVKRYLQEEAGHSAHLKMGITQDESLGDRISITVIATGFENQAQRELPFRLAPAQAVQEVPVAKVQESPVAAIPAPAPSAPAGMFQPRVVENHEPLSPEPAPRSQNAYEGPYGNNVPNRRNERESLLDNDLDVPAYLRKGVVLASAPASDARDVSRITIGEDSGDGRDMTVRPNRHLHDNVD